jgi:hypothetical protein
LYIPKQESEALSEWQKMQWQKEQGQKDNDPLEMWQHETHKKGDTGAQEGKDFLLH